MSLTMDPHSFSAVRDLYLVARRIAEGFMHGANRSVFRGPGQEFSQYRNYEQGDDLKKLDWKLFARSDRYFIRESETESNLRLTVIIDSSASMNHTHDGLTKLYVAKLLAASLGYLAHLQGDSIQLCALGKLAAQNAGGLSSYFDCLDKLVAGGRLHSANLADTLPPFKGKNLIVLLTDLYEQAGELTQLVASLQAKHEVIVLQLMAANELNLNFNGHVVEDLETGKKLSWTIESKRSYQALLNSFLADVALQMANMHVSYTLVDIARPFEETIRQFLLIRNQKNQR